MLGSADMIKLRTLLCFVNEEKECSVTNIARTLGVEKYLISRALVSLEKEGLVNRSNPRMPMLTKEGQEKAEFYASRVKVTTNHLIYEGVNIKDAREDALIWALYGSEEALKVFYSSADIYQIKYDMRNQKSFSGEVLCKKMEDGIYEVPFLFYREHIRDNNNLSMANMGFHQPCILHVQNGKGTIQLHIREVLKKSMQSGNIQSGHVKNFKYYHDGYATNAEINGNILSFSAAALNFINIGTGVGQILHGSVCVEMECTVGNVHMPRSKAIFTIMI